VHALAVLNYLALLDELSSLFMETSRVHQQGQHTDNASAIVIF